MKTRNLCALGAAVAAMIAFSGSASRAADAMGTVSTTSTMSPGGMSGMAMDNIDYKVLIHPMWDYMDLQYAKAYGLSDSQIATVAKISEKSGWSFMDVLAAVQRGETFPGLAQKANLTLSDVMDSSMEQDQIAKYKMAYEHTGKKAMMDTPSM